MRDGDVAVITFWSASPEQYIGKIVQRYGNTLITLGNDSGCSWTGIFSGTDVFQCRVRILEKGETLIVE